MDPVPFHAVEDKDGTSPRRSFLLISYCFPPDKTVGALRWQKLATFATKYGWRLDAITVAPVNASASDLARLSELPPGSRVFVVPQRDVFLERFERAASRVYSRLKSMVRASGRTNAGIVAAEPAPDAGAARPAGTLAVEELRFNPLKPRDWLRSYFAWVYHARLSRWAREAAAVGVALSRQNQYALVLSSGPPHRTHRAARLVSERVGAPYVLDLRDPWSQTQRLPESLGSPLFMSLARRDERWCFPKAALVVANTDALLAAMVRQYPGLAPRLIAVRNGCDDDPLPASSPSDRFTIRFAGTVYFERDPRVLFRAAGGVVRELGLTPSQFRIEFVGAFDAPGGFPLSPIARQEGIDAFLSVGSPRSHREALEFFGGATMLVTFPGYNSAMTIPAKTFEYLRFDAWILAMTEPDTPLARLLSGTTADVVAPDDVEAIGAAIKKRYLEYASGHRPAALARDGRFGRAEQADILFTAIERALMPVQS